VDTCEVRADFDILEPPSITPSPPSRGQRESIDEDTRINVFEGGTRISLAGKPVSNQVASIQRPDASPQARKRADEALFEPLLPMSRGKNTYGAGRPFDANPRLH
jgi:hypothetical protein